MTRNINILQELGELKSSLATQKPENVYSVPTGYFDTLAEQVMRKIKASEAETAAEKLESVSPLLAGISKKTPYKIPADYFDDLEERLMEGVRRSADYQTRDEELEEISPLLSGLKKEMPFSVPDGYFENLSPKNVDEKQAVSTPAKVISITGRKWFRYAAAAVVIGIIAVTGLKLLNNKTRIPDPEKAVAKIEKKLDNDFDKERISTEEVENFLDLTESLAIVETKQKPAPVNQIDRDSFLEGVSDDEIVNLLDELPEETELEMLQ